MTDTWLLGVDAGLTNVKAALFAPDGEEGAVAARDTPNSRPAPDRSEVDLDALWATVAETVRAVVEGGSAAPEEVAALAVAGHGHGLYLLDEAGEPVRPGIRSTDSRATGLVEEWEQSGRAGEVRETLGYAPFAADPLSLLGWLRRHEPESYEAIDRILFCKDYLTYRLTDRACTDEMEASVFYDPARDDYAPEAFDALDLSECADALPEVVPSGDRVGEVTEAAAEQTGLAAGTPVAAGLHDVGATALGSGAHSAGQGVLIVGTWGQSIVVVDDPISAPGGDESPEGITRRYLDGWLRYKGNRSAAACVDWFVEEFGGDLRRRAEEENVSPYAVYNRAVDDVPAGAGGVLFHPYLHGSTDDPDARGGFYGLTAEHTASHMLRAIYEGVAVSQAERLAELEPTEGLSTVYLTGGGARSAVWSDIFADVLGDDVIVPDGDEAGARGAAVCAALASGVHPDYETAVERMVSADRRHSPDPETAARYRELREIFEEALAAIRPSWKRLSDATRTPSTDGG